MKKHILQLLLILLVLIIPFNISYAENNMIEQNEAKEENGIKVVNNYNEKNNQVTVQIISPVELKPTKPTWKYSSDRFSCTKVISENTTYTTPVEDINGKVTEVEIKVTEIRMPQLTYKYKYDENTNKVTVTIISDIELKPTKPTWKYSADHLSCTKVISENTTYTTPVEDKFGHVVNANIEVTGIIKTQLTTNYIYDEKTNKVTVEIISNVPLKKEAKPTWNYNAEQMKFTKVYTKNESYDTLVENKFGEVFIIGINVTQVRTAKITVSKVYDKVNNKVTVTLTSDIELKHTKITWNISDDHKVYTKEYTKNEAYPTYAEDIYGNVIKIDINVFEIDEKGPEVKVEYKFNIDGTVTIYLRANEPLLGSAKPTWDLTSETVFEKAYSEDNQDYNTVVKDIYGNATLVWIKFVKKIENISDTIKIGYIYTSNEEVIASIISTVGLQPGSKPTWNLSEDGKIYTKVYKENTVYTTTVVEVNGRVITVPIKISFFPIKYELGIYGQSGAKIRGIPGGSDLEYLKFGYGPNVVFLTFCVHGYEDGWAGDGGFLVDTANAFYNRLIQNQDYALAEKWTIYVLREVNPDGRRLGYTNNGPGRRTLYSKNGSGIDLNRCWPTESTYERFKDDRNYNGTSAWQAYEAEYLRDFLLSHKSQGGQTVLIDLHGWENQLIGDPGLCEYYRQQYPTCRTHNYGNYGSQYLIKWAKQNLGARTALVELPLARSYQQANAMGLTEKYITATLNMLRGI